MIRRLILSLAALVAASVAAESFLPKYSSAGVRLRQSSNRVNVWLSNLT